MNDFHATQHKRYKFTNIILKDISSWFNNNCLELTQTKLNDSILK